MATKQHYPPDAIDTTPNGTEIAFYEKRPKQRRHYLTSKPPEITDAEYPSVTGILSILDKPSLKGWTERNGVAGAIALAADGGLPQDEWEALERMKKRGLCWWQHRDKRAEEGTLAHEDLVRLAVEGTLPDFEDERQAGFARGVCAWHADARPQVVAAEQMVASTQHGFVGRLDLRASIVGREGVGLIDLKSVECLPVCPNCDGSGKTPARGQPCTRCWATGILPPYDENSLQVGGGYELASIHSGHPPTDWQLIVRVDAQGQYNVWEAWHQPWQFAAVLEAYKALKLAPSAQDAAPSTPGASLDVLRSGGSAVGGGA